MASTDSSITPVETASRASGGPAGEQENTLPPGLSEAAFEIISRKTADFLSPVVITGLVRIVEGALVIAVGLAVYLAYVFPREGLSFGYLWLIVAAGLASIVLFQAADLYTLPRLRRPIAAHSRLGAAWTILFAGFATALFLFKAADDTSRLWFASWYMLGLVALLGLRVLIGAAVRRWMAEGRLVRRAVLVGGGENARLLIEQLQNARDNDIEICGIFDDRGDHRSPSVVEGFRKLGTVQALVDFARRTRVDLLIVTLPITAERRVLQMMRTLWVLPVDIRLAAHTQALRFRSRSYSYIGNVPFLDLADRPIADWDYVIKWLFDKLVATAALLALSPVLAATALAIKLDSRGPVFFRQRRYGFNNELIEVFKFRSMYVDQCDATANRLVTKEDPRVTRVGRFIRKTSLDELPQLLNVLKGELSLVGPRPHALQAKAANELYDQVVDGYFARHRVKPGITGWAQIHGWRGETDTREKIEKRVEYDLHYIENWSVLLDIYVLVKTPFALLKAENAY
jgi:Undecaprenyl-phosphate glucose phosphotransferase